MRAVEYFPLSIKKNNQIWLILQDHYSRDVYFCRFWEQNHITTGCLKIKIYFYILIEIYELLEYIVILLLYNFIKYILYSSSWTYWINKTK